MGIIDKLVSGAKNTGSKISEGVDVHSLNSKISDEKKIVEKTYHEMGEYYYTNKKNWADSNKKELDEMCKKIDRSLTRISELEKEIEETKTKAKNQRDANSKEAEN